jgi:hypothetical protein
VGVVAEEPPESAPMPTEAAAPQARLFEPPPANVTPSTSPTIRPPKAPLAAVVAEPVKVVAPGASKSAVAAGSKAELLPGAGSSASAHGGRPTRPAGSVAPATQVLIPPTMDPGRKTWAPQRPGMVSRVPWRAVGTLGVVLLMIVGGAVWISHYSRKVAPATRANLVERLHDGGSVARSKDLYYIVVYQTPAGTLKPAESPAYKHAKFLADHGEDVSIERLELAVSGASGRTESWYWVVSVKGFASATEAKPYRDQIVKIGDQMSPGVWKGAYAQNRLSMVTGPGAPR